MWVEKAVPRTGGLQFGIAGPIRTYVSRPLRSHLPVALTAWSLSPRNRPPDRRTQSHQALALSRTGVSAPYRSATGRGPVRLDRRD
jgi:hypothetical protein